MIYRNASGSREVAEADEDFVMTEGGTEDDEQTLEEEEQLEEGDDHKSEIDNLQKEGIPYCQELLKVYIYIPLVLIETQVSEGLCHRNWINVSI